MKSIISRLVLAMATLAIVPDALAAGSDSGEIFLDAKFGRTYWSNSGGSGHYSETQSSWGAGGGYRWKLDDASLLGFEVGYMHFGHTSIGDPMSFSSRVDSVSAISAGANLHFLFGDDKASYMQGRIGVMSVKFDGSYTTSDPGLPITTGTESAHSGGWYFGVGIGRYVTQNLGLVLAFDYYGSGSGPSNRNYPPDLDLGFFSLEAEFRF